MVDENSGPVFGFLNSENFSMSHSYQLSYSSFAGEGLALGIYTNKIKLKLNDKLNFQLYTSLVSAPYSSLGKDFQNQLNGIYIDRAQINYKPSKTFNISLQYRNLPASYYNPYGSFYGGYASPFFNGFSYDPFNE